VTAGTVEPASSRGTRGGGRGAGIGIVPVLVVVATLALGLPEGSLGVLWPSISAEFGQPLAASGVLLYAYSGGYLAAALLHGALARRFRTSSRLIACACVGTVAAIGFAVSPLFAACVVAYAAIGLSGGGMDSANNSYVAVNHGHRLLSIMHGGFGIGAFVGPALVAVLLQRGASWRWALVGLAAYDLVLVVLFVIHRAKFVATADDGRLDEVDVPMTGETLRRPEEATARVVPPRRPGRRPMLWLSMASFFAYTGVEVGVGFWGYSLLVDRGIEPATAGLIISAYWLALTAGRFSIGALARRVTARQVVAGAVVGALIGTTALWVVGSLAAGSTSSGVANAIAVVVIGASLSGVFPSLVALTPDRLGTEGAASAIGWQLATASLGASTIPAVIGVVAGRAGVEIIAAALVLAAVLLAVVHVAATVVDVRNRRIRPPIDDPVRTRRTAR
jgi:fucose permease